jgi:hypothetical protein
MANDLTDEIKKATKIASECLDDNVALFERIAKLEKDAMANQGVIDNIVAKGESRQFKAASKGLGAELWQQLQEKNADKALMSRDSKLEFQVKGNMLTSTDLISAQNAYNSRQGIVPAQSVNFRDLLTNTPSPTGVFQTYRETNSLQSFTAQTEGNVKTQVEYQFTQGTATSKYISAFLRVSKQMLFNGPFVQSILPRLLLRDFYKKENDYLFTTIAGNSTGVYVGSGTVDAEELINVIMSQRKSNFEASIGIIDWTQYGRLLVTKPNDYSIPGGFVIDANGTMRVAGCPIIGASWAQTDHVLVLDTNYYELLTTEGLNVQFSYEDSDNFERNLVTIRCEAFEEINRLRDDASIYRDFSNS